VIVVGASVLLEALLRTPAADAVEDRLSPLVKHCMRLICSMSKSRR
jgi:hypothetical protein